MTLYRAPIYEHIFQTHGIIPASIAAGTYWFSVIGTHTASGTGLNTARPQWVLDLANHPGITVLNLQVSLTTTATQTGVTFTWGLYPVANTGTTTTIPTFGTVIANSTATVTAPATAAETSLVSLDFALPAANLYMVGLATNATTAASSLTQFTAILRGR